MIEEEIQKLERLAKLMDDIVRIPGTNIRIGLDSLTGFVPIIGDLSGLIPAVHIIGRSRKLGISHHATGRMLFNSLIDFFIGTIPIIGDIFDIFWNANLRNVAILREELQKKAAPDSISQAADSNLIEGA